jgi:hypothetical protein
LVENPGRRVIEGSLEIVVGEIFPQDFNVFVRGVRHRVGEKRERNSSPSSGVPNQKMRFATARSSSE